MSTNEVLSQISTFLAAGHETTASAMTWCLYALVKNPEAQRRLRKALQELEREESGDGSDEEEQQQRLTERISRCEYLDWVVRESLRVHAPVTNTMRVCMRDEDEIPLSQDDCGRIDSITSGDQGTYRAGGYLDKTGQRRWGIKVKKWDIISIPIQAINKSQALWGKDAQDFRWVGSILLILVLVHLILSPLRWVLYTLPSIWLFACNLCGGCCLIVLSFHSST